MAIEVFNRQEIKYLLSDEDKNALLDIIGNYMDSDPFNKDGRTYSICNLYLDTPADELIVKSLEKPIFKEKSVSEVMELYSLQILFILKVRKSITVL